MQWGAFVTFLALSVVGGFFVYVSKAYPVYSDPDAPLLGWSLIVGGIAGMVVVVLSAWRHRRKHKVQEKVQPIDLLFLPDGTFLEMTEGPVLRVVRDDSLDRAPGMVAYRLSRDGEVMQKPAQYLAENLYRIIKPDASDWNVYNRVFQGTAVRSGR